jgi:hypothetical protein
VVVLESLDNSGQVRSSSEKHKHMEDLMGATPDVEDSRPELLWPFASIYGYSAEVETCFEDEPTPAHLLVRLRDAKRGRCVPHRNKAGYT